MGDQGDRKTVRAFQCRDYLFEIYDRMSSELGCSVDYLINEAMREYARAREQTVAGIDAEELIGSAAVGAVSVPSPQMDRRPAPMLTPVPPPMERAPAMGGPAMTAPPPLPGHRPSQSSGRRRLVLKFNGQTIPIDKDEFIIGRGARTADLAIRDGNISRRHAAVVFHDGVYFMKDLGSTNGIEYAGQRVESKRIEEGDIYSICDYEIRFSFQ
jgi:hypothetical protein